MALDSSIIDSIEKIQQDLHDATSEDLFDFWYAANRLLLRVRHPATLADPLQAAHHARAILWIQQHLFAKRTKPLCSKGVFRDLSVLSATIEEIVGKEHEFRTDRATELTLLRARLELIQLAPGIENGDLTSLATHLEGVLALDSPGQISSPVPAKMVFSFEAIVDAMERDIQTEDLMPISAIVEVEESPKDEIPDLVDF